MLLYINIPFSMEGDVDLLDFNDISYRKRRNDIKRLQNCNRPNR